MKKLFLATASAVAIAFTASASALESGAFYIKPVIGYNVGKVKGTFTGVDADNKAKVKDQEKVNHKGFRGGIGFGYNISEDMRADVTISTSILEKKYKKVKTTGTTPVEFAPKSKIDNISMMVTGYYHFASSNSISPYVAVGAGIGRSKMKVTDDSEVTSTATPPVTTVEKVEIKSKKSTKAIYRAAVGVDFSVAKGINLDVNYGIGNAGDTTSKEIPAIDGITKAKLKTKANIVQSVEAAVRFSF